MSEIVYLTIPRETVNDESVRILSWKVASGAPVEKGALICEVDTSKVVVEINAPTAGIVHYEFMVGDEILVGATICRITPTDGAATSPLLEEAPQKALDVSQTAYSAGGSAEDLPPPRLTQRALKMAAECAIDIASFPAGALVREKDVLQRAGRVAPEDPLRAPPSGKPGRLSGHVAVVRPSSVAVDWTDLPRRKTVENRIIGSGQASSLQSSVTHVCRALNLRAYLKARGQPAVSLGTLVIFEAARLLRKHPVFNAVHDSGRMGCYRDVNVGWAIDGGQGLVVPVIAHADGKSIHEIAVLMELQLEAYLENSLTPAELMGGTFTISDLSSEGVQSFQPLISQGQSAILGIGRDWSENGSELLYLTLAFDHQLAEGRRAAHFVRELSARLESYAAVEGVPAAEAPRPAEALYCILCERDSQTLRKLNAVLLRSEIPAGHVCSFCVAGF